MLGGKGKNGKSMESLNNGVKHLGKIPTPEHPSVSPFPDYSAIVCLYYPWPVYLLYVQIYSW